MLSHKIWNAAKKKAKKRKNGKSESSILRKE